MTERRQAASQGVSMEYWLQIIAGGESLEVEFKSDARRLSDGDLVEAVVCMANGKGGTLFLGVEDDGRITGLHPDHQDAETGIVALVANRTVPPVAVRVDVIGLMPEGDLRTIAALTIPESRVPVATRSGRILTRCIEFSGRPGCRPLYPNEIASWGADRALMDQSALPVLGVDLSAFDVLELARLRRMVELYRGDASLLGLNDSEIGRALGLVADDGTTPTLAGLLLLGKESVLREQVSTHEIALQVLSGAMVTHNEFLRWPLLRAVEYITDAFRARNEERELSVGLFRVGIPAHDPDAFREALNNALVHRDYGQLGAVHVQLHDDRVVILNPGGFVRGVRPDNLLSVGPRPRNPRLADCFKRIGLVERTGRGVGIMYSGQLRNGRLPPSFEGTTEASVRVSLQGGHADLDFVELVLSIENRAGHSMHLDELQILSHIRYERDITTPIAARLTQRPEAYVRGVLEGLVESGVLERRGERRARVYHLSATVYRGLGQAAAYVRTHGFEPRQIEQMILQYVE
ncbi:MAG: ATP-binding protein, partial [Anaerolineae bacterium]